MNKDNNVNINNSIIVMTLEVIASLKHSENSSVSCSAGKVRKSNNDINSNYNIVTNGKRNSFSNINKNKNINNQNDNNYHVNCNSTMTTNFKVMLIIPTCSK